MYDTVIYRRYLAKVNDVDASVSIIWRGENYLLKMIDDSNISFGDTLVCRLWLGFEPNTFMLSPDNYDVKGMNSEREMVYQGWLTEHMRYKRASRLGEKSILPLNGTNVTGSEKGNGILAGELLSEVQLHRDKSKEEGGMEEKQKESMDEQLKIDISDGGNAERSGEGVELINSDAVANEDLPHSTKSIVTVCQEANKVEIARLSGHFSRSIHDWNCDISSKFADPSALPSFWTEFEHDRSVARAVAG